MTTTTAAASPSGRHRSSRLVVLLALLLALLQTTSAAAPPPPSTTTSTTRLRGAVYSDVDATFERDFADGKDGSGLPPVFPASPRDAGSIVVPVFVSRSHSTPYIEVVRHLAARGYRVVLLTDVRNARWIRALYGEDGGPFEVAEAPAQVTEPSWELLSATLEQTIESANGARALASFIGKFGVAHTLEIYPWVRDWMAREKPALVVADSMQEWLVDCAEGVGARLVVTASGLFPGVVPDAPWAVPLTSNYPAATLEKASFVDRVRVSVLEPIDAILAMLPVVRQLNAARVKVGLSRLSGPPADRMVGRLHLINSLVGHEIARPFPQHVRLIGPIRSDGNTTLDGEWRAFVDGLSKRAGEQNPRIIYAAYGQNCVLRPDRLRGVLSALRQLLREDLIDGAIWSLSMTPDAYLEEAGFNEPGAVPAQIKLTTFAPQKALLASPAVRVFVSHGGAESVGEGIYYATPMLMAPHFGDQSSNAYRLEATGMALVVPKEGLADAERVAAALRRLLSPGQEGKAFVAAARRMRALALASARLSSEKAADEVEYILHYGDDHLRDPSMGMGLVRRNNLDVLSLLVLVLVLGVALAVLGVVRLGVRVVGLVVGGGSTPCSGGVCKIASNKRD